MSVQNSKTFFNEKYHDNCHDYLKKFYVEKYADTRYKDMLYLIKNKIPKLDICNDTVFDDYGKTVVCDQHAVIFSKSTDKFPIVATYALNACIGLVMYCTKYKVVALAHIDGLPGYSLQSALDDGVKIHFDPVHENIKMLLTVIRNICNTEENLNIDYYLVGGIFNLSEIMVHDIIECINNFEQQNRNYEFYFKGRNILGPENQSRNICFNSYNGKITYFDYVLNSEYYSNNRLSNGLSVNILKAPRQSEAVLDITYTTS